MCRLRCLIFTGSNGIKTIDLIMSNLVEKWKHYQIARLNKMDSCLINSQKNLWPYSSFHRPSLVCEISHVFGKILYLSHCSKIHTRQIVKIDLKFPIQPLLHTTCRQVVHFHYLTRVFIPIVQLHEPLTEIITSITARNEAN